MGADARLLAGLSTAESVMLDEEDLADPAVRRALEAQGRYGPRRVVAAALTLALVLAAAAVSTVPGLGAEPPAGGQLRARTSAIVATFEAGHVGQYDETFARALASLSKLGYCDNKPGLYSSAAYSCGARTGLPNANQTACDDAGIAVVPGSVQTVRIETASPQGPEVSFAYTAKVRGLRSSKSSAEAFLIVFRGSFDNQEDQLRDLMDKLVPFYGIKDKCPDAQVHAGFHQSWEAVKRPLLSQLTAALGPEAEILCTGHGTGAAACALASYELQALGYKVLSTVVFSMPRVGNEAFAQCFAKAFGVASPFFHVSHAKELTCGLPRRRHGSDYAHVGTEVHYPGTTLGMFSICWSKDPACGCSQYGEARWDANATCRSALAPEGSFCEFGSFPATCFLGTGFLWSAFGPSLGAAAPPFATGLNKPQALSTTFPPWVITTTSTNSGNQGIWGQLSTGKVPIGWW